MTALLLLLLLLLLVVLLLLLVSAPTSCALTAPLMRKQVPSPRQPEPCLAAARSRLRRPRQQWQRRQR